MDINELKGLLESATPGPWEAHDGWVDEPRTGFSVVECSDPIPDDVNNARLIAAAPTHLADLITALEQIERIREVHAPIQHGDRQVCAECVTSDYPDEAWPVTYPCPTIRILDGNEAN